MIYNDICASKKCNYYIEWDYSFDPDAQPYPCTSCKLVGESHNIDIVPDDCPFRDEIIRGKPENMTYIDDQTFQQKEKNE